MTESFASPSTDHPASGISDLDRWVLARPPADLWPNDSPPASDPGVDGTPSRDSGEQMHFESISGNDSEPSSTASGPVVPEGPAEEVAPIAAPEEPRASVPAPVCASVRPSAVETVADTDPAEPVRASLAPIMPRRVAGHGRLVLLAVVCAAATLGGAVLAIKINDYGRAARMTDLSAEVSDVRAEQDKTRAELEKQSASLAATREALRGMTDRQKQAEAKATAEISRVDGEQVLLARDIAATRHAQARTEEHVYQLSEALKLIDWATTGGTASETIAKASAPRPSSPRSPRPLL